MQKYIVLFRGINVGGNNVIVMKSLVALLQAHQYQNVSTYIQSGNVILSSEQNPEVHIKALVNEHYGFSPDIFTLTEIEFATAIANNPYPDSAGNLAHFYFCKNTIILNTEKIAQLATKTEQYQAIDNVFYLHAPDGIGRSKLVAKIEQCLGQSGSGRNLNTINKLNLLLQDC